MAGSSVREKAEASDSDALGVNPDLLVVQRRLFDPTYQGAGRWVIFDPTTRRSFLAVGGRRYSGSERPEGVSPIGGDGGTWPEWAEGRRHQDVIPDVLALLAAASGSSATREQLRRSGHCDRPERIDQLLTAGMLRSGPGSGGEDPGGGPRPVDFLRRYHGATFDYPFHDYFDPEWRKKDLAIMTKYKEAWSPPPIFTERPDPGEDAGRTIDLPEVTDSDALPGTRSAGDLTPRMLAAVLRLTLGSVDQRNVPVVGPLIRRTSPSGGSRHPTELVVLLPRPLRPEPNAAGDPEIPPGAYYYAAERHALVPAPGYGDRAAAVGDGCAFLIVSHVERAMWRYREIRSFRPIPIDAGHVLETLTLLLGLHGLHTAVHPVGPPGTDHLQWVAEPELALVTVGEGALPAPAAVQSPPPDDSGRLVTNPAAYLTFADGRLQANMAWPTRAAVPLELAELQVLGHCLPSTRGDRRTTPDEITTAIPEVSAERIERLCEDGVLLPYEFGQRLDREVRLWARYGWYLSWLAHLEVVCDQRPGAVVSRRVARLGSVEPARAVETMRARRTLRNFTERPIERTALEPLLDEATRGPGEELTQLGAEPRVMVASLAGDDQNPTGVWEWMLDDAVLRPTDVRLDRTDVRAMTIGQEPISKAAVVVWLIARAPLARPATYQPVLLTLGRLGQRLCLLATAQRIGAFMTPAVGDTATAARLGLSHADELLIYAFGLGYRDAV